MLVAGVFFSLMNIGVKYLDNIPAIQIVFFRSLVTLIISFVMIRKLQLSVWGNNKPILFLRGLFGVVALSMYFYSLQVLPLASSVTLMQLSPIFTAVFAIFILKEKVKLPQWLFFAIAFAGVAIIKGFDKNISLFDFSIAIASAAFSALAYNMVRKLKDTDHPLVVVFYFPLVALPLAGIASIFVWVRPTFVELLILLGIGVCTQIAQVNLTKAMQMEELAKVSIVQYLTIIYAIGIGFVFFKEVYTLYTLLGIALVILGVLANLWYSNKFKNK